MLKVVVLVLLVMALFHGVVSSKSKKTRVSARRTNEGEGSSGDENFHRSLRLEDWEGMYWGDNGVHRTVAAEIATSDYRLHLHRTYS